MPGRKRPPRTRREQILRSAYHVAARRGVDGLTIRLVASDARLSSGLLLFHYKTKRQLLLALLDWLLDRTLVPPDLERRGDRGKPPLTVFLGTLRREMHRLSREPAHLRLLFAFWVLGARDAEIGARMREELDRYRAAFRPIVLAVLRAEPARFHRTTAEGMTTVAVSFIKGCAVQAMIDPDGFGITQYLHAAESLIGRGLASAPPPAGRR
jgi:TetR/AcrR family transcriptional repressor of bet genes